MYHQKWKDKFTVAELEESLPVKKNALDKSVEGTVEHKVLKFEYDEMKIAIEVIKKWEIKSDKLEIRKQEQFSLGKFKDVIQEFIKSCENDLIVVVQIEDELLTPTCFDSYRGRYEDISLDYVKTDNLYSDGCLKMSKLLVGIEDSMNFTFSGHNGGEFSMDEDSFVWISPSGVSSELALTRVAIEDDRCVLIAEAYTVK